MNHVTCHMRFVETCDKYQVWKPTETEVSFGVYKKHVHSLFARFCQKTAWVFYNITDGDDYYDDDVFDAVSCPTTLVAIITFLPPFCRPIEFWQSFQNFPFPTFLSDPGILGYQNMIFLSVSHSTDPPVNRLYSLGPLCLWQCLFFMVKCLKSINKAKNCLGISNNIWHRAIEI